MLSQQIQPSQRSGEGRTLGVFPKAGKGSPHQQDWGSLKLRVIHIHERAWVLDRNQGGSEKISIIPQIPVDLIVEHFSTIFETDLGVFTTDVLSLLYLLLLLDRVVCFCIILFPLDL